MSERLVWGGYVHASLGFEQWRRAWWMKKESASLYKTACLRENRATYNGGVITLFQMPDSRLLIANEDNPNWPDMDACLVAGPFDDFRAARVAYELLRD